MQIKNKQASIIISMFVVIVILCGLYVGAIRANNELHKEVNTQYCVLVENSLYEIASNNVKGKQIGELKTMTPKELQYKYKTLLNNSAYQEHMNIYYADCRGGQHD